MKSIVVTILLCDESSSSSSASTDVIGVLPRLRLLEVLPTGLCSSISGSFFPLSFFRLKEALLEIFVVDAAAEAVAE